MERPELRREHTAVGTTVEVRGERNAAVGGELAVEVRRQIVGPARAAVAHDAVVVATRHRVPRAATMVAAWTS
jgi:hypothetical protein